MLECQHKYKIKKMCECKIYQWMNFMKVKHRNKKLNMK